MRYIQPFDKPSNPTAPYVNQNLNAGVPGSVPPAEFFNVVQQELVALIEAAGLVPSPLVLTQVRDAVLSLVNAKSNLRIVYGIDIGTVNNIEIDPTPGVDAWSDDLLVITHVANPTTAVAPKLKLSDLSAITITLADGGPLISGDAANIVIFKIEGSTAPTGPRARLLIRSKSLVSGEGVAIDASNHVNLDFGGLANGSPAPGDRIAFFRNNVAAPDEHLSSTLAVLREFFLNNVVVVPVSTAISAAPGDAGFELDELYSANELQTAVFHGTNANYQGGGGVNSSAAVGLMASSPTPLAAVNSTLSGNYRLTHWVGLTGGGSGWGSLWINWLLIFVKAD